MNKVSWSIYQKLVTSCVFVVIKIVTFDIDHCDIANLLMAETNSSTVSSQSHLAKAKIISSFLSK